MEALLMKFTLKFLLLFLCYFVVVGFNVILFAKIIKDREFARMYRTRDRVYIAILSIIPMINIVMFLILSLVLIFETNETKYN